MLSERRRPRRRRMDLLLPLMSLFLILIPLMVGNLTLHQLGGVEIGIQASQATAGTNQGAFLEVVLHPGKAQVTLRAEGSGEALLTRTYTSLNKFHQGLEELTQAQSDLDLALIQGNKGVTVGQLMATMDALKAKGIHSAVGDRP